MATAASGVTYPAAGVIATRPATSPEAMPSAVGLPRWRHSTTIHPSAPPAAPRCVVTNASDATYPDDGALPALKPNHPNHKMPAPVSVIVRLWGRGRSCGYLSRLPTITAHTNADAPAVR